MHEMIDLRPYVGPVVVVAAIAACEYVALLTAILLDFRAGTRKARERGEKRTSKGFRRTVTKAASYFITLLSLSLMDVPAVATLLYLRVDLSLSVPALPLFTTIGSLAMIIIEGKSIRESADSKVDLGDSLDALRTLLGNDSDTLRRLIDRLRKP